MIKAGGGDGGRVDAAIALAIAAGVTLAGFRSGL
jgi:hypothetical protein